MNKIIKFFIALLGGINVAYSIFIPIAISLIIVNIGIFNEIWTPVLIIAGALSSLYRGIDVGILRS